MPRSSITVSHRLDNGQNTASAAQELLGEDAQADVQIFVSPKSASELSAPPARGRPKEPSPPQSVTSIWSSKSTTKRQPVLVGENLDWAKQRLLDGLAHSRIKDVRQAIADGVDVNFRDAKGDTPLHHAARNGKLTMAQLLLDLGGDPTLVNRSGERAAEVASTGDLIDLLYREPVKKPPRRLVGQSEGTGTDRSFDTASLVSDLEPWHVKFLRNPIGFICAHVHDFSGAYADREILGEIQRSRAAFSS